MKLDLTGSLYYEINHIKGPIKTWKRLHTYTEYINMTVFSLWAFQTPAPLKGIKLKFEQMTVSLFSAIQMSAELHPQQSVPVLESAKT